MGSEHNTILELRIEKQQSTNTMYSVETRLALVAIATHKDQQPDEYNN